MSSTRKSIRALTPLACEPSEEAPGHLHGAPLPCARFRPIVTYDFRASGGEQLNSISTAQRLHFVISSDVGHSSANRGATAVFRDCDGAQGSGIPLPCGFDWPYVFWRLNCQNPLLREVATSAILGGRSIDLWDNFHQTFKGRVDEPIPPPGCPECVHIHWRWSNAFAGAQFRGGNPLIPMGSNQSVNFAIVHFAPGEEDPIDYRSLVTGDSLFPGSPVFWYSATGFQDTDQFFTHGGFFSSTVR